MKTVIYSFLFTALVPLTAQTHHAFRVAYDFNKTETLEGQVVKLELVNPHARIFINVTSEDGKVEEWMIEGPGRLALERRGWTEDMFVGREAITAIGNPSSEGRSAIWLEKIIMPDGTEIIDPLIADQLAIENERRERARRASQ